jgi:hypothetical protein
MQTRTYAVRAAAAVFWNGQVMLRTLRGQKPEFFWWPHGTGQGSEGIVRAIRFMGLKPVFCRLWLEKRILDASADLCWWFFFLVPVASPNPGADGRCWIPLHQAAGMDMHPPHAQVMKSLDRLLNA